ncbi:MAG: amino acid deaminase/aldolase, partial [Candidatus Hydrogenedentes bacterium]|nr:amino acid deaminase/aldolase [Candidatus Hydrogenedentota bacterium]
SGYPMPLAFVARDLVDQNARDIAQRAGNKHIRIASKSIRCVPLLERLLASDNRYRGIMAYSAREAVFLSQQGLDDILIGYPVMRGAEESRLCDELRRGKRIICMVDCAGHVESLVRLAATCDVTIPLCIDLDLSSRFPGLHFGVHRSPLSRAAQVVDLCRRIADNSRLRLTGLMGYEAQIAGLPDNAPGGGLKNTIVRMLKRRSLRELRERRSRAVEALRAAGMELAFVNGGGTGSMESTAAEDCVTEVTAGSGFFSPVLFDWYAGFKHRPAVGYAVEITRKPDFDLYTCHGGGYVASGVGKDKNPRPYLPEGAALLPHEGAGEVQTPIRYTGPEKLNLGDPVYMRYAKAGERCERFNCLLAVSGGQVVDELPTYRGEGQVFL